MVEFQGLKYVSGIGVKFGRMTSGDLGIYLDNRVVFWYYVGNTIMYDELRPNMEEEYN